MCPLCRQQESWRLLVKECIAKIAKLRTAFSLTQPLGRVSLLVVMSVCCVGYVVCHMLLSPLHAIYFEGN